MDTLLGQLSFIIAGLTIMPMLGIWFALGSWGMVAGRRSEGNNRFGLFFYLPFIFSLWGFVIIKLFMLIISIGTRFTESNAFSVPLIVIGIAIYIWTFTILTARKVTRAKTIKVFGLEETVKRDNLEDVFLMVMWVKYVHYSRFAMMFYYPWFKDVSFKDLMR